MRQDSLIDQAIPGIAVIGVLATAVFRLRRRVRPGKRPPA